MSANDEPSNCRRDTFQSQREGRVAFGRVVTQKTHHRPNASRYFKGSERILRTRASVFWLLCRLSAPAEGSKLPYTLTIDAQE